MIFIAKPDYEEYELLDKAVIIADTEKEAFEIANSGTLRVDFNQICERDRPQQWIVEEVNKKGVLLTSINW